MWALILAGALAAPAPEPAAPAAPATQVAPVTVQAPASEVARARGFVDAYAAPTAKLDRYARWINPPCIVVSGLAAAQAAGVKARIEEVARAAGLKPGGAGCKANVEIEFTGQPQALVDQIVAKTPEVLGYQPGIDAKALKTVTRPIQAWYMTASHGGANGLDKSSARVGPPKPSLQAPDPGIRSLASGRATSADSWIDIQANRYGATPGSALSTPETLDGPGRSSAAGCDPHAPTCQSVFWNVLVVVDVNKVIDHGVSSLTDYVAMLALSQPRSLDGCLPLASIIDMLAPTACADRDPPDALTPADTAYLAALYASDPEATLAMQQSVISERMAGVLVKATPAPDTAEGGR